MNKYLFFDIECADGYNICAFGYVITDYNFNVLLKEDIKINPKKKVLVEGRRPTDDFQFKEDECENDDFCMAEFWKWNGNFQGT